MINKEHIQHKFKHDSRSEIRRNDASQQVKVLVELKKDSSTSEELILYTDNISNDGVFLLIDENDHCQSIGDYIEVGFVIDNQPILKFGIIRRIIHNGMGIELFNMEKIDL